LRHLPTRRTISLLTVRLGGRDNRRNCSTRGEEDRPVAKSKMPEEAILDGLKKAYDALPELLPLAGTKGIFTAKQEDLAGQAVRDGLLAERKAALPGKGKKAKEIVYGVLTEAGLRKLIEKDSPRAALERLLPAVQSIATPAPTGSPGDLRAELEKATAACVSAVRDAVATMQTAVLGAISAASPPAADPGPVLAALRSALERVETPVLKSVLAPVPVPTPTPAPAAAPSVTRSALELEIVSFVEDWARARTVGPPFDELMKGLRARHPDLTVGAFHDALRRLHDAERVRLGAWPRTLDDLPEPELALFLSSKVMYYAQPAHRHG
jgi:hypothetical protein